MDGALELCGFCQVRILAQLKLEGSKTTATAMNLPAMERLTATLTAMEGSTVIATSMNSMAMEGLMATATEMED